MAQQLFRKAAREHVKVGFAGRVVVHQPRGAAWFSGPLLAGFMFGLWLLANMEYSEKVTVAGYLAFKKGLVAIRSPEAAMVSRVLVTEGDWVESEAPLVELNKGVTLIDRTHQNSRRRNILGQELSLLEEQMQADLAVLSAGITKSELTIRNLQTLIADQRARLQLLGQKRQLGEQHLLRARQLVLSGALSSADFQQVENKHLTMLEKVALSVAELHRLTGQHQEQQLITREFRSRLRAQAVNLKMAMVRLKGQLLELAGQEFLLVAPAAGRVSGLSATVGMRVTSGQALLSLLDESAELEAVLLVPPRSFSRLKVGLRVNMRYAGFPYQRFGLQEGVVSEVGRALLLAGDANEPIAVREPVYKVRVKPRMRTINAYGEQLALTSGMLLEGDLVSDVRPLWMWLLDPLLRLRGR